MNEQARRSSPAESSSSSYGPTVRLGLLSTPPRGDAVTFGYGVVASSDTDSHRADVAPSRAHSFPHAFSGNPGEILSGPPIETFGGDNFGIKNHKGLSIPRSLLRRSSFQIFKYVWLDFRFWIFDWGKRRMKVFSSKRVSDSCSDNRQSKTCAEPGRSIQNLKWAGLLVIVVTLTVCGVRAEAQQPGKIFRIGFLDGSTAASSAVSLGSFWQDIRKLGWIEGKNLTVESRFTEGKNERLPELAADLVRLKVDLIVVTTTASALAAKSATTTIPIVMTGSADPLGAGLIASLARPGGNVTGVSNLSVDLNTKRLEVLKDAVPKLARVGLPHTPRTSTSIARDLQMKELRPAAVALKLKLEEIETPFDAKGLESFFKTAKQKQVGAIMTGPGPIYFTERKRIVELAVRYRLPAIYFSKEFVVEGGFMSYGVDYDDLYRRAAVYVDKILKGAKPADLPVQQATKFEFVINLRAAKQIGVTIPVRVLERANRVIR